MKYILMHRETVVAVLSVNDISGTVYRVDDVLQPAHPQVLLPPPLPGDGAAGVLPHGPHPRPDHPPGGEGNLPLRARAAR